jgi:uncharacterized protein
MSASPHVRAIESLYAAFLRGDVPAIQALCAEDTTWGFAGAQPDRVPWHRPVQGRAALPGFVATVAEAVAFEAFEPQRFVANGDEVIVQVRMRYVVRATGRVVDMVQVHWWTLDAASRVRSLMHYEDTAQVVSANAA